KDGKDEGEHTVAGGYDRGIVRPQGLSVDREGSLYIADGIGMRIVKWPKNSKQGKVIARGEEYNVFGVITVGKEKTGGNVWLKEPTDVLVHTPSGAILVVDQANHRVIRFQEGDAFGHGEIVAGGHGKGNDATQLARPYNVALDSHGNLFVSDWDNHRIQMFARL
ncbi:unnamed protein product, partial [Didymodactylos carnosus]